MAREALSQHITEAQWEDIAFLMSPDGGSLTRERIAERTGCTIDALEKRIESGRRAGAL